jgi:hypothetical protein
MAIVRATVLSFALAIALTPIAALAADTTPEHMQAELANAQAQWDLAQQQVVGLQQDANFSATNERMIAVLRSEALRQRQLDMVTNATALEKIAAGLANVERSKGEQSARNSLAIAQLRAGILVTQADAKLANAMAIGRADEIANAQAQSNFSRQVADLMSGQQAEFNMGNARIIGEQRADAIHTPAIVQQQNGIAMGANSLLAADVALQAGTLNALSATISAQNKGAAIMDAAQARLNNARVRAGVQ